MVPAATTEETTLSPQSAKLCRRFSLPEILSATKNFDDGVVIGKGGFGKVYKGHIKGEKSGTKVVAIKRLGSKSSQGAREFMAEIKILSELCYCHLVSLIGYCDDSKEKILVYEYLPNGTLDYHLHSADTPLSWKQRLDISIGVARGLDYLHTGVGTQHGIIHRDLKSSNILLDEDWTPKISDFGLSKIGRKKQPSFVSSSIKGTFGYLDREFVLTGNLSRKTDVFAFGVVLFELLSGRRAVDTSLEEENGSLAMWAKKCFKEKKLNQILDSKIKGQISPKCLKAFAQIAYRCLDTCLEERPTMPEVVVALYRSKELQKKFDRPAQPTGVVGFTKKMHKFIFVSTEVNSAHRDKTINKTLTANLEGGDLDEVPHGITGKMLTPDMKLFTYSELKGATRNFNHRMVLGMGKVGIVFKGWIDQETYFPSEHDVGLAIAVRKLHKSIFFKREKLVLRILREFCHPNIVRPLGLCFKGEISLIVHEFVQNGSLADRLFKIAAEPLPWITKVKIAVGVARGLVFLANSVNRLIKFDLFRRHNILLDEECNAKLSDCDVSMLVRRCDPLFWRRIPEEDNAKLSAHGYDPLYYHPIEGSPPRHGFSFGMLLLELLTGQRITTQMESSIERDVKCGKTNHGIWREVDYATGYHPQQGKELVVIARSLIDEQDYGMQQALVSLERLYLDMTMQDMGSNKPLEDFALVMTESPRGLAGQ